MHWIIERARKSKKYIYSCFIDCTKAFDCVDHNNCGKLLKRKEYQTTLPASCETCMQVKKQQLELNMEQLTFKIGKGVRQGCILSPCLFNFCAEYIMWNVGLDEPQVGIKMAGRNTNNLICKDNTTLMAESEGKLKSLLMKVKKLA